MKRYAVATEPVREAAQVRGCLLSREVVLTSGFSSGRLSTSKQRRFVYLPSTTIRPSTSRPLSTNLALRRTPMRRLTPRQRLAKLQHVLSRTASRRPRAHSIPAMQRSHRRLPDQRRHSIPFLARSQKRLGLLRLNLLWFVWTETFKSSREMSHPSSHRATFRTKESLGKTPSHFSEIFFERTCILSVKTLPSLIHQHFHR